MAEQVFHKGDQVAYAYNAAQAVNLRADGWMEGAVLPSAPEPETVVPPEPVLTAPTSSEEP
jgi:hypothetical protein